MGPELPFDDHGGAFFAPTRESKSGFRRDWSPSSRVKRKLLLSASSLALLAASSAPILAQNDKTSPAPPTAVVPQSPAVTPAPSSPTAIPEPQQENDACHNRRRHPRRHSRPPAANVLPETRVVAPVERRQPRTRPPQVVANRPRRATQAQVVATQNEKLDAARRTIMAPIGATSYEVTHQAIEALPQGVNTSLDKVLLQTPGVSQDSAASGDLHVRNEHGNVQYRINGIQLPDGVGAFGQILDTGIVGSLALITGALPAQFGLRTSGVVDIQTKTDAFNNCGSVSLYGGSHQTITPYFEYGGTAGQTQYFVTGRYLQNNLGLENPTPANEAIHDHTTQERGFAYVSTVIDPTSRLTYIGGIYNATFQIPNNPGQPANFTAFGLNTFDSSQLNERQYEFTNFNVVSYQKSAERYRLPGLLFQPLQPVAF